MITGKKGGGSSKPPEPPLATPLCMHVAIIQFTLVIPIQLAAQTYC